MAIIRITQEMLDRASRKLTPEEEKRDAADELFFLIGEVDAFEGNEERIRAEREKLDRREQLAEGDEATLKEIKADRDHLNREQSRIDCLRGALYNALKRHQLLVLDPTCWIRP